MKVRLLKTGGVMFCIAQDKDTRSDLLMLTENFGMWFGINEFEFIEDAR